MTNSEFSAERAREERAYALGVQVALWGKPLVEYVNTTYAALKAGATYLNYFRVFPQLKTAADRYVNTPNNVSIDAYCAGDVSRAPLVTNVPAQRVPRWTIVQIGDCFDRVVWNIGGSRRPEPGLYLVAGPDYHGPVPFGMTLIRVPTQIAIIANRVFVDGEDDLPAAREVQSGFHVLPLSIFETQGLRYEPETNTDSSRFEFVPEAPETLPLFEQIGFGMELFLPAPPVSVFWNLAMYDDKEFFIENDLGRYSIGSTADGLTTDTDGSITITIQNDDPGEDKRLNWLPAPAGSFNLTVRLYGARAPILNGSYRLPAVSRLA